MRHNPDFDDFTRRAQLLAGKGVTGWRMKPPSCQGHGGRIMSARSY
jgi:hypothetical protein